MSDDEFRSRKLLKLKYGKRHQIIETWFPQEIRSLLFNLWIFPDYEKNTPES